MRLWYFLSSVTSGFKRACAAIQWDYLIFGRTLLIFPYFMCANSEDCGETARMCRLCWAFAGRLCDKYHNLMSWLNEENAVCSLGVQFSLDRRLTHMLPSRMSSNSGQVRQFMLELLAVDCLAGKHIFDIFSSFFFFFFFLIWSLLNLQKPRKRIKSRTSTNSGKVRQDGLLVYRWFVRRRRPQGQLANLDQILCVASLGRGIGYIRFWGRSNQNSG